MRVPGKTEGAFVYPGMAQNLHVAGICDGAGAADGRRQYLFSAGIAAASAAPVGALAGRLPCAAEGLARAPNPAPEAGALPALNTYLGGGMGGGGTRHRTTPSTRKQAAQV